MSEQDYVDTIDNNDNNSNDNHNDDEYEKVCFVCHRPESVAGKMINLPNNMCVCNDCMQKSFDAMNNMNFGGAIDYSQLMNMPGVQFLNIDDMSQQIPKQQRVKKKKEGEKTTPLVDIHNLPAPHKIKASLDEYVVGQEYAKKVMSVAVYNHYKRVATDSMDDIEIEKSNMLMIGPTGSGKTYLVKTLARILDVPLAITDATSLTEAGYIGDDIESVVSKLLAAADNDVEKAEQGIIFIDVIDKIAKKKNASQRDVSGDLKDKYDHDKKILEKVTTEDLRNFGMIPEFLGRLPVVFTLQGLTEDMYVKILEEPKNAILKQYQKLLALDEVKLDFTEGALRAIAKKAMEKDTGARALRAIIEEFMLDIMYEIPKDDSIGQVTITQEYIENTGGPIITLRGQEVPRLESQA